MQKRILAMQLSGDGSGCHSQSSVWGGEHFCPEGKAQGRLYSRGRPLNMGFAQFSVCWTLSPVFLSAPRLIRVTSVDRCGKGHCSGVLAEEGAFHCPRVWRQIRHYPKRFKLKGNAEVKDSLDVLHSGSRAPTGLDSNSSGTQAWRTDWLGIGLDVVWRGSPSQAKANIRWQIQGIHMQRRFKDNLPHGWAPSVLSPKTQHGFHDSPI